MQTSKIDVNFDSWWERFEARLKTYIYTLMHELLESQLTTPFLYNLLIFVEAVQMVWYSVHPNLSFLWNTSAIDYVRTVIQYFQLDNLLNNNNSNFFLAMLYLIFAIQAIVLLGIIVITCQLVRTKKKSSTFLTYSIKLFSLYAALLPTIFTIPFAQVFFATFFCKEDDNVHGDIECYTGLYWLHLIIGAIGFIFFIVLCLLFSLLYAEINPISNIPFASPQTRIGLIKLLFKLALPLYIVLDYQAQDSNIFIGVLAGCWLLLLIFRYRAPPHYNKVVHTVVIVLEAMIFWFTVSSCVHAYLDPEGVDNIGLFYAAIGGPFTAFVYYKILDRIPWHVMKMDVKKMKEDDYEAYVNILLKLIDHREKSEERIRLEGMLKRYIRCSNKKIMDENPSTSLTKSDEEIVLELAKDPIKEEDTVDKSKMWYTLLRTILCEAHKKWPKSAKLHMLHAYIQHQRLKNKYKAYYELMIAKTRKPSLLIDFSIFRYMNLIEEEMIDYDIRNSESKGMDVNVIVEFQNKFVDFQSAIEKSVMFHLDFWRELLETNPDIQKLHGLGAKITKNVESTSEMFQKLKEINPNNIKCLQLYGNYLRDIVNDVQEGERVIERAEYADKSTTVNKQFVDSDRLKYGENSNTCIVTCSGNHNSMGMILNVNNESTRLLGFAKNELIGKNITEIQPKIYADLHDGIMRAYFEYAEGTVFGMERVVFPITKNGYIVPCSLMVKVLPNLDEGLKVVGFLKDIEPTICFDQSSIDPNEERVHYIIYGEDDRKIYGITQTCYQSFGIPASLVSRNNQASSNELTIETIIPEILTHNIEELKSLSGAILNIDTTNLPQNFLMDHSNHERESEYALNDTESNKTEENMNLYRKAKIRVNLTKEEQYGDLRLRVIKFVEDLEIKKIKTDPKDEDDKGKKATTREELEKKYAERDYERSVNDNASERSSNISAGSTANDDMRQLKDIKVAISEKSTPKSIKNLQRTMLVAIAFIIGLAAASFGVRNGHKNDISSGISAINYAYQRTNTLADLLYYVRKLELLGTGLIFDTSTTGAVESIVKSDIANLVSSLQTIQFNVINSGLDIDAFSDQQTDNTRYSLVNLLQDGTYQTQSVVFDDAMFKMLTSVSSIRNSSISSFNMSLASDSTPSNFFYVDYNGLRPLRGGAENISSTYYQYYYDRTTTYVNTIEGIMIAALVLVFIFEFAIVPSIFSVQKTNNRVLSLFGYIPEASIDELAEKCEIFLENYIDDRSERQDYDIEESQPYSEEEREKGEEEEEELNDSMKKSQNNSSYLGVSQNEEEMQGSAMNVSGATEGDRIGHRVALYKESPNRPMINRRPSKDMGVSEHMTQTLKVPDSKPRPRPSRPSRDGSVRRDMDGSHISVNRSRNSIDPGRAVAKSRNSLNSSRRSLDKIPSENKTDKPTSSQNFDSAAHAEPPKNDKEMMMLLKQKEEEEEKELEEHQARSQKLMNSRDNNRISMTIQFTIFALIYAGYFIADFVIEVVYVRNVRDAYVHMQQISQRPANVKFVHVFTQEELAEGSLIYIDDANPRLGYINLAYALETNMEASLASSFPSQFGTYLDLAKSINTDNPCQSNTTSTTGIQENLSIATTCATVGNGTLTKGLKQAIITLIEQDRDLMSRFFQSSTIDNETKQSFLNDDTKFTTSEIMINYIDSGTQILLKSFQECFDSYLKYAFNVDIIKFAVFIVYKALVFFFVWLPYLKRLAQNIWRTKGMLNMIPMEIMSKNENLKAAFIGTDILQAVR